MRDTHATHTPGPWTAVTEGAPDAHTVDVFSRGEKICTVGPIGYPVVDADARLIAAAPELYAAVQRLMNVGRTAIDARPDLDWNDLCALLARIEGRNL